MKQPEKRNWEILYTDFKGPIKRAVELVTREMGGYILRDAGVYCVNVLPVKPFCEMPDKNAVIIGTYESHPLFGKLLKREEVPKDGYAVKVLENPFKEGTQLVLLCGDTPSAVFYAACHFTDDCLSEFALMRNGLRFPQETFLHPLPSYSFSAAPKAKTRSLFTWGHPINNFRETVETLARLKFNQIIVWNDYLPQNAEEFTEYAHSFGVSVIWGFAWGWFPDCKKADLSKLGELKEAVLSTYESTYKGKGDGIYFQSFTELSEATLQGRLIADVVTDFVNEVAGELLKREPELLIQFGLHANSVKEHTEYLAKIDPRVQIIWENCGVFPYSHEFTDDEAERRKTEDFTRLVISQRPGVPVGMVFKGMLKQDWPFFEHQAGSYIMGDSSDAVIHHDMDIFTPIWRFLQSEWLTKGDFAHTLANIVLEEAAGDINFCVAAHIADKPWYPLALCGELFWDAGVPYTQIVERVSKRRSTKFA